MLHLRTARASLTVRVDKLQKERLLLKLTATIAAIPLVHQLTRAPIRYCLAGDAAEIMDDADVEVGEGETGSAKKSLDGDLREHLNVIHIGHVDSGKSTLSGSILYHTGQIDQRTIEKFEREAKQRGRESWWLAYILDTTEEERSKGITVEVGRATFETPNKRFTILDAPGHKSFVANMIQGAAQADIAVLVISARKGEFETGFEKGGQTREHALLAKTLGVRVLIVVINKMDESTVNWSKERYDECVGKLTPFLKASGYNSKHVHFLPVAALNGANIKERVGKAKCPWYDGPALLELLDGITIGGRDPDGPLRVPVLDKYIDRGIIAMGKVESGTLKVGQELLVMPQGVKARWVQRGVSECVWDMLRVVLVVCVAHWRCSETCVPAMAH